MTQIPSDGKRKTDTLCNRFNFYLWWFFGHSQFWFTQLFGFSHFLEITTVSLGSSTKLYSVGSVVCTTGGLGCAFGFFNSSIALTNTSTWFCKWSILDMVLLYIYFCFISTKNSSSTSFLISNFNLTELLGGEVYDTNEKWTELVGKPAWNLEVIFLETWLLRNSCYYNKIIVGLHINYVTYYNVTYNNNIKDSFFIFSDHLPFACYLRANIELNIVIESTWSLDSFKLTLSTLTEFISFES